MMQPEGNGARPSELSKEASVEAGRQHDTFNVYAITPLIVLTLGAYLTSLTITSEPTVVDLALSWGTLVYLIIDIIYSIAVPSCYPTNSRMITILIHHVISAWLVLHPILYPQHLYFTKWCTIVEINTMFVTVNRLYKVPGTYAMFAITWILMRVIWYPALVPIFHHEMVDSGAEPFSYSYCQVVGSQIILCVLTLIWSFEAAAGMMKAKKIPQVERAESAQDLIGEETNSSRQALTQAEHSLEMGTSDRSV